MVLISLKHSEGDGFLYETTIITPNSDLISSLVTVYNDRLRSKILIEAVRDLANYGPMKNSECTGLALAEKASTEKEYTKDNSYNADPSHARTGDAPEVSLVDTLRRTAQDLEEYIDKSQVQRKVALSEYCISDKINLIRAAVTMAYPMDLPDNDTVKIVLDENGTITGSIINGLLDSKSTSLWVAGKEFEKGKLVSDRLGHNEKTKVIAKLQKTEDGPPSREPIVSEVEKKAMMAHYFKRQEELKKLGEADDDDYLNSKWADSNQMKRGLQGLENVRLPGMRKMI